MSAALGAVQPSPLPGAHSSVPGRPVAPVRPALPPSRSEPWAAVGSSGPVGGSRSAVDGSGGSRPAEAPGGPSAPFLSLLARRVLDLLADGHADDAIARRLGVTVPEVKREVAALMTVLGAWSRPAVVAAAFNREWLTRHAVPCPAGVSSADVVLLGGFALGWPASRIAEEFELTADAVDGAAARLRRVFKARDRAHLVRRAVDAGVLPVPIWMPGRRESDFETREGCNA